MGRTTRRVTLGLVAAAVLAAATGVLIWRHASDATAASCRPADAPVSKATAFATLWKLADAYASNNHSCIGTLTTDAYEANKPGRRVTESLAARRDDLQGKSCTYSEADNSPATATLLCNSGSASFELTVVEHHGHVLAERLTGADGLIG